MADRLLTAVRAALAWRPLKDFVIDFVTGIPAGWGAVTFSGWDDVNAATAIWTFAIFKAGVQALTRLVLKWASS